MSKVSRWVKENVEVVYPFEEKDVSDEYYPLGGPQKKLVQVSIGYRRRGIQPGPPHCPCDPPRRYIGFKILCAAAALTLIIWIILYLCQ